MVTKESKFHKANLTNAIIFIIWVRVLNGMLFSSYREIHIQKLNHCNDAVIQLQHYLPFMGLMVQSVKNQSICLSLGFSLPTSE